MVSSFLVPFNSARSGVVPPLRRHHVITSGLQMRGHPNGFFSHHFTCLDACAPLLGRVAIQRSSCCKGQEHWKHDEPREIPYYSLRINSPNARSKLVRSPIDALWPASRRRAGFRFRAKPAIDGGKRQRPGPAGQGSEIAPAQPQLGGIMPTHQYPMQGAVIIIGPQDQTLREVALGRESMKNIEMLARCGLEVSMLCL